MPLSIWKARFLDHTNSLSPILPTEIARAGYRLAAILKKIWP